MSVGGARRRLWGGVAAAQGRCEPVGARSTANGDSLWPAHELRRRCSWRLRRRSQSTANGTGKRAVRGQCEERKVVLCSAEDKEARGWRNAGGHGARHDRPWRRRALVTKEGGEKGALGSWEGEEASGGGVWHTATVSSGNGSGRA